MAKEELLENIKIIRKSAELVYGSGDYTSATILYFKLLFSVLDYVLLINLGKASKDHTERFRLLERSFPELYKILDKYFPVYQSTYSIKIRKEVCDEVKEKVEEIYENFIK